MIAAVIRHPHDGGLAADWLHMYNASGNAPRVTWNARTVAVGHSVSYLDFPYGGHFRSNQGLSRSLKFVSDA